MNSELKGLPEKKSLPLKMFRSPWLFVMEGFFVTGAIFMIISILRLFDPSHVNEIMRGLVEQEVAEADAVATWFAAVVIVKLFFTFYSVAMAVGFGKFLISTVKCENDPCKIKGLGFFAAVNRVSLWTWVGLLGVGAVMFVIRFAICTVNLVSEDIDFAFPLMAVIIGEAIMLLMLVGVSVFLILTWRELSFLCDHLRYMLYSGRVEGYVQSFCCISLIVTSFLSAYLITFFFYDPISMLAFFALASGSAILGALLGILRKRVEHINYENYLMRQELKKNNK